TPMGLTDREQAVLELLALGLQNKQIATRLAMSTRTVERHCDNIYAKFAVHSRTEAVLWALGAGLVRKPHAHQ
ncbi:MAG: LuxR C-terminal-related transcriptional regulator, partial [Dermatophilaceae bacterium]